MEDEILTMVLAMFFLLTDHEIVYMGSTKKLTD